MHSRSRPTLFLYVREEKLLLVHKLEIEMLLVLLPSTHGRFAVIGRGL